MNIEVVGRLNRRQGGGRGQDLAVDSHNRVAARPGGSYFNFSVLYSTDSSTHEIFKSTAMPLLELWMAGFNVCVLIGGESESGKSYTLAGDEANKSGMVAMIYDYLFAKLTDEKYMLEVLKVNRRNPVITMQMYEVYNELVKDLLQSPGGTTTFCDVAETASKGVHVKNGTAATVRTASDGMSLFRQGIGHRTSSRTDYGQAQNYAATVVQIDLQMLVGDHTQPNKSRFTVVELPGLEKLSDDPAELRLKEGSALNKGLVSLNHLVTTLAGTPYPERVLNYSDSKLTQLLKEELGGNCKTKSVICLNTNADPSVSSGVLKFAANLSQVKNFPIINDSLAQNLCTQYRAEVMDKKHTVVSSKITHSTNLMGDSKDEVRRLQTENLMLRDTNERLQARLDQVQGKFGSLSANKTDLSQQLLFSEEEKLRVSQSLVEIQIENNKVREDAEALKFELTNKILLLENSLVEAEAERDKQARAARHAKDKLADVEKDRKELADEYVALKTNYMALSKEHDKEDARNQELSIELLNLVNAKAAMMKQLQIANGDTSYGDPHVEIERVRAIVIRNSDGKVKADEILGTQKERESVEQSLFANRARHDDEIKRLSKDREDEITKLKAKFTGMQKELDTLRHINREREQKISELNAKLITLRGEKEALELQVNRAQHKAKDLGEDYRYRLMRYIEDISEYVDKGSGVPDQALISTKMREYVDSMLKELHKSHKIREDQLSQAAQNYRQRMQKVVHKYEEVLIAYRNLRQLCQTRGIAEADMGPDETEMNLTDSELESAHLKESQRVKLELKNALSDMDTMRFKMGIYGEKTDPDMKGSIKNGEAWASIRKQLREFTLNTQRQLEEERAKLMAENQVLKEQVGEANNYIDIHLVKYKQEIMRLRKLLGQEEDILVAGVLSDRSYKGKRRH